jgi:hypothetical protein
MATSSLPPCCCICGVDNQQLRRRSTGQKQLQRTAPPPCARILPMHQLALDRVHGKALPDGSRQPPSHVSSMICNGCSRANEREQEQVAQQQRTRQGKQAAKAEGRALTEHSAYCWWSAAWGQMTWRGSSRCW